MDVFQAVKEVDLRSSQGLTLLAGAGLGLFLVGFVLLGLYNIFLHPLKDIPGPLLWRAYYFPYCHKVWNGTIAENVSKFHAKYGDTVRLSPNQVSFSSGDTVWQDIYNFHSVKGKKGEPGSFKSSWLKDITWYAPGPNGVPSLLITNEADHARQRRILSHAFSDKAIKEQEPLVMGHVDELVKQLRKRSDGQTVNLVEWYDFVTFDVITDLMFGEPFDALRNAGHPHLHLIFKGIEALTLLMVIRAYPFLTPVALFFIPPKVKAKLDGFVKWSADAVTKRLDSGSTRPDFIGFMLREHGNVKKDIEMSKKEMDSTAGLLLQAGAETTSTMMAGTTYQLSQNPEVLAKLKSEVRGRFKDEEITADSVSKLPYLDAVIKESLRMFPPVPTGFPRVAGQGGGLVNGHYIPEGTSVYVSQIAANRSPTNFREPNKFIPERWLGDSKFDGDKQGVWQPFSFGPRNCIGKNLAWMEMRLLLSKMIANFDFELNSESQGWMDRCKCFALWQKPHLDVKLKAIR